MLTDDTSAAALLPITEDDFRQLQALVEALDANLAITAERTEEGDAYIAIETRGHRYGPTWVEPVGVAQVVRTAAGWAVEGPEGGCRQFKPGELNAVAAYLAFGDDE